MCLVATATLQKQLAVVEGILQGHTHNDGKRKSVSCKLTSTFAFHTINEPAFIKNAESQTVDTDYTIHISEKGERIQCLICDV